MSYQEYAKALKSGERAYRNAVIKGEYPYLPALDELLECVDIRTEESLGLVDIPISQIVGTKTAGRKNAFAVNFMPLMTENTEFALKWIHLYEHQINDGVRDPIKAYEFMNKFYVLEGNKRVSVFKYLDAFSIEGTVTRIIPKPSDEPENKIYYEFLEFYHNTAINYLWFSREGSFQRMTKAVGKNPEEVWSEEERKDFSVIYTEFLTIYNKKGGNRLPITPGDAFLFYLSVYPYKDWNKKTKSERKAELDRIWSELPVLDKKPSSALVFEPSDDTEGNLFTRFFNLTSSKQLRVTFIHDKSPENSSWTYGHELGRMYLDQTFGERIHTESFVMEGSGENIYHLLDQKVDEGNHIIFTTSEKFLGASLKAALEHPSVKILNCSLNRPYRALRTYYGRMYEAKFLCGMIAGAMTENEKIAYVADFPIFGSLANINAFARGALMTNPRAKIYLYWNSEKDTNLDSMLKKHDISLVSDSDMIRPSSVDRKFGLYTEDQSGFKKLATPIWNWGKFYEKILRDILQGTWNKSTDTKERQAVNYWWGISGDIIDLIMSQNLPEELTRLIQIMRQEIFTESFHPFSGILHKQDGSTLGEKDTCLTPEQIITMDWLAENVIGEIPSMEKLTESGKALVELQGILNTANGEA